MKFAELVGKRVDFYGADNHCFCLGYRGKRYTFEAVEDESDGYRSMLQEIHLVSHTHDLIFYGAPVARVAVLECEEIDGYRLIDARDNHVWLRFGTDRSQEYYPWFVFEYQPKLICAGAARKEEGNA